MMMHLLSLFTVLSLFSACVTQYVTLDEQPKATLSSGTLKGKAVRFRGSKVYQFLNIPFAEPPVGGLRFKKPIPKTPWTGELKANEWGPHCMQGQFPEFNSGYPFSEDCLGLNVFVSANSFHQGGKPVMVFIHGGGFGFGSANHEKYDGTALVGLKDVILVSVNYRLNVFGFLYLPEEGIPGNMGLWDQNLALKWVQDNIKKFGGDPDQVTIFGESAGSISVSAHILSPQSKGLFKNAIMQSAASLNFDRWANPDINTIFLDKINCPPTDRSSCLTSFQFDSHSDLGSLFFWPITGDEFLPANPDALLTSKSFDPQLNVLLGAVGNEGAIIYMIQDPVTFHPTSPTRMTVASARHIFAQTYGEGAIDFYVDRYLSNIDPNDSDGLRLAVANALGDTIITCPTYVFGRNLVNSGLSNVFAYHQTQRPSSENLFPLGRDSKWLPATHCDDIPMVYGHPFLHPDKHNVEDALLSSVMMDIWTTFARTGKPPQVGQEKWLPWANETQFMRPTMILDSNRIGQTDSSIVDNCFNNWPFPLHKLYSWTDKLVPYQETIKGHNEL